MTSSSVAELIKNRHWGGQTELGLFGHLSPWGKKRETSMKQFIGNLKLSTKLLIAPFVVILFLVVLGCISYFSLSNQKSAIEDIFVVRFKSYQMAAAIVKDMANVHANLYKVISWGNAKYDEKKIDTLGKAQLAAMEQAAKVIEKVSKDDGVVGEGKKLYQSVLNHLKEYQTAAFSAIDLAGSDLNMATMYMETAENKFQVLSRSLNDLLEHENRLSQDRYNDSLKSFSSALKIFIIVLGIAIGVSVLMSLLIARLIITPIHETVSVIKKIAEGDLTQEIEMMTRDEIGELTESVNTMRLKMGDAVGQSGATSQILSEAASEQAASLEETSSSLEEMFSMTKQNADNTAQANKLMTMSKEAIQKANISMNDLTQSIKEIADASEKTQKIVKTIDEIAFQTNLLALNAAVEAARAGEVGAGFAVVADEVRNLAMRAAEAAKDTSHLIGDIVTKVKGGEQLVMVTNKAFQQVSNSSDKVVGLISEIATGSEEQSQGIEQINRAVAEMNKVTQQNAASAEELASIMAMFRTNHNSEKLNQNI